MTFTLSAAAMRAALTDGIRRTLGSAVSKRQHQQHLQQQHQLCSSSSNSSGSTKRRPQSATASRTAAGQRHTATTLAASTTNATVTSDGGSSKQWASRTGPARLHNLVSMVAEVLALCDCIMYALFDAYAVVVIAAMCCWASACT
jgi:hypothetical protein